MKYMSVTSGKVKATVSVHHDLDRPVQLRVHMQPIFLTPVQAGKLGRALMEMGLAVQKGDG